MEPRLQNTLREADLVSEFALYYAVFLEGPGERRFTVYCEHGDQFDPISRVEDYSSPLSTPLSYHVVSDSERRIVPLGKIGWILDVSAMKYVHPPGAIPQWVASKYFYNVLGRAITYLMIPFVLSYLAYRTLDFRLEVRAHPRKNIPERRWAAGGALGASEARRSTPDEGREAGELGQDTPPTPRRRQTARGMKLLLHWRSRCVA